MKKKKLICIVLCFVLLLCSCSKTAEKEPAVLDTYVLSETESNGAPEQEPKSQEAQPEETKKEEKPAKEPKKELPGLKLLSKEEVDGETVFRYEEQDYSGIPTRHMENALIAGWNDKFSSVLNKLENKDGGLVVVGHATGVRESHFKKGYTKTQFVVEKVIFGEESDEVIAVREGYTYREDEQGGYFYSLGDTNTKLENDKRVLLFLRKSKYEPTAYAPCWFDLAVPADYMDYNEEYFAELLDYYRGDRSVYQAEGDVIQQVIEHEDGSKEIDYISTMVDYWPEREISDEALLEELSENILVQAAKRYKVKILPLFHKENACRYNSDGIRLTSIWEAT